MGKNIDFSAYRALCSVARRPVDEIDFIQKAIAAVGAVTFDVPYSPSNGGSLMGYSIKGMGGLLNNLITYYSLNDFCSRSGEIQLYFSNQVLHDVRNYLNGNGLLPVRPFFFTDDEIEIDCSVRGRPILGPMTLRVCNFSAEFRMRLHPKLAKMSLNELIVSKLGPKSISLLDEHPFIELRIKLVKRAMDVGALITEMSTMSFGEFAVFAGSGLSRGQGQSPLTKDATREIKQMILAESGRSVFGFYLDDVYSVMDLDPIGRDRAANEMIKLCSAVSVGKPVVVGPATSFF